MYSTDHDPDPDQKATRYEKSGCNMVRREQTAFWFTKVENRVRQKTHNHGHNDRHKNPHS